MSHLELLERVEKEIMSSVDPLSGSLLQPWLPGEFGASSQRRWWLRSGPAWGNLAPEHHLLPPLHRLSLCELPGASTSSSCWQRILEASQIRDAVAEERGLLQLWTPGV